jgi:hypothetical protein
MLGLLAADETLADNCVYNRNSGKLQAGQQKGALLEARTLQVQKVREPET